jgi:hypothetical protein
MKRLRWLLAFVFFCAVDFANPLAAAPHETFESMEEGSHLAGHRRVARAEALDRRASRVVLGQGAERRARAGARVSNHHRGARAPARKVPPPLADSRSSSAPADDPDAH